MKNKLSNSNRQHPAAQSKHIAIFLYILIFLLPFCVFLNSLSSGFVYDDIGVIEDNYFIRSFQNISKIFGKDYFSLANELSYRPVVTVSYLVDYAVWHLNPFGYHLTNVIFHSICSVFLYILTARLFRSTYPALFSAALFSIHPCVTEAVNAISYREDIFAALFSILSFLCLTLSARAKVYYVVALFFYFLGLFSKETVIVVPVFIFLYWVLYMRGNSSSGYLASCKSGILPEKKPLKVFKVFVEYYLGYILISLFYLVIRFVALKNPLDVSAGYVKGSMVIHFLTMVKILASYIKLMFFPFRLSADYTIVPIKSFFDTSCVMSVMLLAATGVIIFKAKSTHEWCRLLMIGFFVALLPVLNIIPIGHIMADRYLYLPVACFCAAMGGILFPAETCVASRDRRKKHGLLILVVSTVFISFTAKTVLRNKDWRNEYAFWTKILEEQPQNYDAHNNLGSYFYKQGNLDRAIAELEEAVRLKKNYPEGHNSLGTMYIDKGLLDRAIAEYTAAIQYKPVFPQAYYNLGNAYIKKGLLDDSIAFFQKAISMGMYNPQVFNNLGSAYMKKGMADEAIVQYQKAASVYKDFAEVHSNLGYVYTEKGDFERAFWELNEALRLQPGHANAHNNLGALYCQKNLLDKALGEFQAAVRFDPKNASAYKNIGMIYFTKGDMQKAREYLVLMLKNDPNYLRDAGILAIVQQLGLLKQ